MSRALISRANTFPPVTFDVASIRYFRRIVPRVPVRRRQQSDVEQCRKRLAGERREIHRNAADRLARSTCRRDGSMRVMGYRCSASEASPWIDRANDAGRFALEWHDAVNCTLVFGDVALGGEEAVALIVAFSRLNGGAETPHCNVRNEAARLMSSAGALPEDRRVPRIDAAGLETASLSRMTSDVALRLQRLDRDSSHTRSRHHSGAGSCGALPLNGRAGCAYESGDLGR